MKQLNLDLVNSHSPYQVKMRVENIYYFKTDYGMLCSISFMDDYSIWQEGAFQFVIGNENNVSSPLDNKLRDTIFCIIDEFFHVNPDILLYIYETGDGKQAFRSRLFLRWFNSYEGRSSYVMETAVVEEENIKNFAALIVQKDNPHLETILTEFKETIQILTNKPD